MTLLEWGAAQVARECSELARRSLDLGEAQRAVLDALRTERLGLTALELERVTGRPGSTVRPRLLELEARGLVERTTNKRACRGSSRLAQVWVAR